eukprot:m.171954 g.171954  ORF g.171954 m.171954 type:complete len:120 (+) comp14565_c0_seq12:754-1113(+)
MGVVLVYSICDRRSFDCIHLWLETVTERATEDVAFVLVGNKVDLQAERDVSTEEGQQLASEIDCPFFEISAKHDINVQEAFAALATCIIQKQRGKPPNDNNLVTPGTTSHPEMFSGCSW